MKLPRAVFPVIAVVSLLAVSGCQTARNSQHWEYRVVSVDNDVGNTGLQERLNSMANEGWVIDQFADHHDYYRVIMKRPAQ